MPTPQAGDRVSEYILESPLGAGGFAQVWKAHHHIWRNQNVAVKIPTDAQYVRNLQKEGITIHGLQHPNIVRALGLDPYADIPYLIMELVEGCSLKEFIEQNPGGVPIHTAHNVLVGILSALDHAHSNNVLHRDIKPANVLISGGGKKSAEDVRVPDVKVTDFGLGHAKQITTNSIMQSGSLIAEDGKSISGTLAYMSPEQRDGAELDARSDLYSVGIVLFEMICGERPSGSDLPSHIRNGLPSWVDTVFIRLYTRKERRLTSATEVLRQIAVSAVPPVVGRMAQTAPPIIAPPTARSRGMTAKGSCPKCHAETEPSDNFCIMCGTQIVPDPRRCMHCQGFPGPDDRFCIFCGTPLPTAAV